MEVERGMSVNGVFAYTTRVHRNASSGSSKI